ncbi:MAG: pyroglutamyl-peptidase I [Erysipelotrichaceae bacterium]|nr:pyroglutamyl-peptidase I [Erysipelotrichaceae bacterium]
MKILLTAFEPFGGEELNSSLETIRQIGEETGGARIVKVILPTVFGRSLEVLHENLKKEKPDIVLCLGEAGGRSSVSIERIAINCMDARIPDNAGFQPVDIPVFADGPAAYFASLPVKKMAEAVSSAGIPAAVSNSAGTFVCNQVMYGLLYYIDHEFPDMAGGFMHLPWLKQQAEGKPQAPFLTLQQEVNSLKAAIEAIAGK